MVRAKLFRLNVECTLAPAEGFAKLAAILKYRTQIQANYSHPQVRKAVYCFIDRERVMKCSFCLDVAARVQQHEPEIVIPVGDLAVLVTEDAVVVRECITEQLFSFAQVAPGP